MCRLQDNVVMLIVSCDATPGIQRSALDFKDFEITMKRLNLWLHCSLNLEKRLSYRNTTTLGTKGKGGYLIHNCHMENKHKPFWNLI